jgi:23S rRNA pseudouridine2605 synthase
MHPRYNVKKVYRARLDKPISRRDAQSLSNGILLDDGLTSECEVFVQTVDGASEVEIAVHEGRKREVRRMFEKLGYKVEGLARVSYAGLTTKGLRRSEWRYLTKQEIHELKKVVGLV